MTHLRIEQNNGVIEEVSSSIITKLYEIAHAGLDVSSNLQGRLHTPISYRYEVQYLTSTYPNLYISSDNYAIPFEDPNMVTYLNSIGVGSNGMITEAQAAAATIVANSANTQVTKFNELRYFTNITQSRSGWTDANSGYVRFYNWTALEEIDISNFTSLGHVSGYAYEDTFCGCTSLKTVTASDKLTRIGHRAFSGCTNLEHITGLSGTIQVSNEAFYNCSKLPDEDIADVEFEPAYEGIHLRGESAFGGTNFTEITLSPNTTIVPYRMFAECSNLETVNGLGSNITQYYGGCFRNCTKFAGPIDFTNVTAIYDQAFYGCKSLPQQIVLNNNVQQGADCFNGCTSIQEVIMPMTDSIGGGAFRNCSSLTTVSLKDNAAINTYAFADCKNLTTLGQISSLQLSGGSNGHIFYNCNKLVFPNNFTISCIDSNNCLAPYTFTDCKRLTSITLDGYEIIDAFAFAGCESLATINGTEDITVVRGQGGFYNVAVRELDLHNASIDGIYGGQINIFGGCQNLEKITLGDCMQLGSTWASYDMWRPHFMNCPQLHTVDVKSLGTVAAGTGNTTFYNCPSMRNFIIRSTTVPQVESNGDVYIDAFGGSNVKIYVPDAAVNDYKNATGWSNVASYIYPLSDYQAS